MVFLCQGKLVSEALITAARQNPQQVGIFKLSKTQLKVLETIKDGEHVTSSQIADRCEISSSFASTLLRRLCEKRYLQRTGGAQQTGGVEFIYSKLLHG